MKKFLHATDEKGNVIEESLDESNMDLALYTPDSTQKFAIEFFDATIGYSDKTILHNVNLQIRAGEFIAIIGEVGSGKSTIINAIMQEATIFSGHTRHNGTLAYTCALETWIQNDTLKNNILFTTPFIRKRYQRTIEACSL